MGGLGDSAARSGEMDRHLRVRHVARHLCASTTRRRLSTLSRDMTGRVALITGAASGQGDATARVLADEGCRLALCGINSCEDLCAEIIDAGGEAATFEVDLADSASIAQLAKDVLDRFGDVDILV